MPNNRHRRVARLRTPEERREYHTQRVNYALKLAGYTTDDIKRNVPEQTVKESNEQAANLIVRAFNRIASVFR